MNQLVSPRDVFRSLGLYSGPEVFADVLRPWVDGSAARLRDDFAPLAVYEGWRREAYEFGDLLEQAYALSRVSDVLLLGFQPALPSGSEQPWAHALHMDVAWLQIAADQYLAVFTALGMTQIDVPAFDPFFHEIVTVDQDDDPDAPIAITDAVWPGLILGELLFSRAGVRVRAGIHHAIAGIADRSPLHEVFLRRHRETIDGSLGWGHNSQWKTDFRRDYLTADAFHINVDGTADIDDPEDPPSGLTAEERRDLLRNRCLVRVLTDEAAGHDASPGRWRATIDRTLA